MTELAKELKTAPRYTCYPSVPYWNEIPTQEDWLESLSQELDQTNTGLSLYVHIPFCENLCTFCGCNTRITRNHRQGLPYVKTLVREWELYQERLSRKLTLGDVYFGGGTPTFLSESELESLLNGIFLNTQLAQQSFSVEVDPRFASPEKLKVLFQNGFRKVIFGIQEFDPVVLNAVNRVQSEIQVRQAVELAREAGLTTVAFELIYGLPFQTLESVKKTLEKIAIFNPDQISLYEYIHVPWIKAGQRIYSEDDLPSAFERQQFYSFFQVCLKGLGYFEVGVGFFVKPSDPIWESYLNHGLHRNFMGYQAQRHAPLIGLGVSSMGDSWGVLVQNEKILEAYQERVQNHELPIFRGHRLSEDDQVLRKQILNLLTQGETSWESFANRPWMRKIENRLKPFEEDEWVELKPYSCKITKKGAPFVRVICTAFDAYQVVV